MVLVITLCPLDGLRRLATENKNMYLLLEENRRLKVNSVLHLLCISYWLSACMVYYAQVMVPKF